jgi:DNA polymerase-3 subunit delta'
MSVLPWQLHNWSHLCDYKNQNRIPQALLIYGNKGVGKLHLANQFAYSLLCAQPQNNGLSCGHCNHCLLLKAETHPDLIRLCPEESGKSITVGQVRSLITRLTLKPQFDAYRIVIIYPADLMNNSAANAFLKCLEEPTERTIIFLITDKPTQLAATIISRCQKLAVAQPDKETVLAWLRQQNTDLLQNDTDALYNLTQGSPFLALDYVKNGTLTLRNDCFKAWLNIAKKQQHPIIIAEEWHKLPETVLLFWITSWIIDIIKCFYQIKPDWLYNPDLRDSLQLLSTKMEIRNLYQLYDLVLISRQRLNTQINKHNMFEEILIKWSELNSSKI